MTNEVKEIRQRVFSQAWDLDSELTAIAQSEPSHSFLVNPSGQIAFVYLTHFVKAVAEHISGRSFSELAVLDWGCGKGQVTKLVRDLGPKLMTSCDVDQQSPDSAYGQPTPILKHFEIPVVPLRHPSDLPFETASFDVVLSFGVLEHVPDDLASLHEITRILKPNGLFCCFYLPSTWSWTQKVARAQGDNYHDRLYSDAKVEELAARTGLKVLDLWHRQIFPKNTVKYPAFRSFEKLDQFLTEHTFLRRFATNVEFVALKTRR